MTDEEIIGRVRGGETRLFGELVRRYQDPVYGMAARLVSGPDDAQDVAQEVFLRAYRGLEGFKGEAKFSTWLYRVTYNLCMDWLRRSARPDRRATGIEKAGSIPDGRVSLEGSLVDREQKEDVRRALDALQEKYRTVLVLLYYQDMSYEQIAAILDVPLKTVETRLYRARKMLRERLEGSWRGGDT